MTSTRIRPSKPQPVASPLPAGGTEEQSEVRQLTRRLLMPELWASSYGDADAPLSRLQRLASSEHAEIVLAEVEIQLRKPGSAAVLAAKVLEQGTDARAARLLWRGLRFTPSTPGRKALLESAATWGRSDVRLLKRVRQLARQDKDFSVRAAAIAALGRMDSEENGTQSFLRARLRKETSPKVRRVAVEALGRPVILPPRTAARLANALRDPAEGVRRAAVTVLHRHRHEPAVEGALWAIRLNSRRSKRTRALVDEALTPHPAPGPTSPTLPVKQGATKVRRQYVSTVTLPSEIVEELSSIYSERRVAAAVRLNGLLGKVRQNAYICGLDRVDEILRYAFHHEPDDAAWKALRQLQIRVQRRLR